MIAFLQEDEADFLDDDDLRPLQIAFAAFLLQDEPWRDFAACRSMDPEIFFPQRGKSTRAAKEVCARCPVRAACGEYADRTGSEYGVWGGELRNQKDNQRVA